MRQAEKESRIGDYAIDPQLPVHLTFDIGVKTTRIWFFQVIDRMIIFVDYLAVELPGIEGAVKELQDKGYIYGYYYFPHDMNTKEITSGRERIITAQKLNMKPYIIAPQLQHKSDGIQAVRLLFPYFRFDRKNCKDGICG